MVSDIWKATNVCLEKTSPQTFINKENKENWKKVLHKPKLTYARLKSTFEEANIWELLAYA